MISKLIQVETLVVDYEKIKLETSIPEQTEEPKIGAAFLEIDQVAGFAASDWSEVQIPSDLACTCIYLKSGDRIYTTMHVADFHAVYKSLKYLNSENEN